MREKRFYTWKDGKTLTIGEKTLVMGILNVTPDSFSDGGKWNGRDAAVSHLSEMTADGADLVDVGAESTRPGATALTAEEETERLFRFLPELIETARVPLSVDTYHWRTAERALAAGAHILNDVWGFQYDHGEMAQVAAAAAVPVILMHNQAGTDYARDIIEEMKKFFAESVGIALAHGVKEENIILDPGIGFGKTGEQNLEILRRLRELAALPFPLLLAPSRKRFIGEALDLPAEERDEGTGAVCCYSQREGCAMVRVHNVKMVARMVRMTDKIMYSSRNMKPKRFPTKGDNMDTISLTGMIFYGYHGALPEERRLGQKFIIDIVLTLDLSSAGKSDDLSDTVNYAEVYTLVRRLAEREPFRLIEKLAGEINCAILAAFPPVFSVKTTVHKPAAPIAGIFEDVAVTLELPASSR